MPTHRHPVTSMLLAATLLLAGCGFHLRQSADLPVALKVVHVSVAGSAELGAQLERQLLQAGADVRPAAGPGVAELTVQAGFESRALSVGSFAQVREFSVQLRVVVAAISANGEPLFTQPQTIDMQREFTYDRSQALGTATREEQVRQSLIEDMARAITRRLQAADEAAQN